MHTPMKDDLSRSFMILGTDSYVDIHFRGIGMEQYQENL